MAVGLMVLALICGLGIGVIVGLELAGWWGRTGGEELR